MEALVQEFKAAGVSDGGYVDFPVVLLLGYVLPFLASTDLLQPLS